MARQAGLEIGRDLSFITVVSETILEHMPDEWVYRDPVADCEDESSTIRGGQQISRTAGILGEHA